MKINFTRQNIYLLAISIFLLIFVLVFSFSVLIPKGKEYRIKRTELRKMNLEARNLNNFSYETLEILQKLQSDNRHIITAFDTEFSPKRFEKQYKGFFSSLKLSQKAKSKDEDEFTVYEVNTTSEISSPKSFYNFLDAINKSDWIVGVNFPIKFKREGEIISSSFTMKAYSNKKDSNTTK
ncbi:MAG: hypothetical protein KAS26_06760 [Sulfurimonas sp.]|nr:hypothetical protein [Sulfurimonas sp.]